ncbi:MAG TPA: hypothetical protein VMG58_15995 [Candidatus Sulfotelmatobacter sp.]|nr:hypothetical protein [Candidatus Sulfotelmatobacter sp.]
MRLSSSQWTPGVVLALDFSLTLSPSIWSEIHSGDRGIDALAILITSERCFDLHGWLRLPEDEQFARVILAPRRSRLALTPGRPSSKGGLRAGDALARGGGAQGRPGQP